MNRQSHNTLMSSRQRVLAAINHRPPDRVPIDLNPTLTAYCRLKTHMGLEVEEQLAPNNAMEVVPHSEVLSALGVDLISVKFPTPSLNGRDLPERRKDAWGLQYRLVHQTSGAYYEVENHPLAKASIDDLDSYCWPRPPDAAAFAELDDQARQLYRHTDLALVGRFGVPIMEIATYLLGMEEWYVRLMTDRDFIRALLDRITDIAVAQDLAGLEAAGQYLQILKVSGEDFGTQRGPLYSLPVFRDLLLPPLRRRWETARQNLGRVNPGAKIMLHSCEAIRPYIPDLIAAGIEILDPVQPLAAGMAPAELHAECGDKLVFHGGVDVQELLPRGTPQQVAHSVEECLAGFRAHRGGFILAPSHTVQADVPPENLLAMIEAAKTWSADVLSSERRTCV